MENNLKNENVYATDYLGEELITPLTRSEEDCHTLIERVFEHGECIEYYCSKCDKSYLTIDDFTATHEINEGSEMPETLDDLIEYDSTEEETVLCETEDDIKEQQMCLKTETDDIQTSSNKYFCYDCRSVFNELEAAEQHDCFIIKQNDAEKYEHDESRKCEKCGSVFENQQVLELHVNDCEEKNLTANEFYECVLCYKQFITLKALMLHSRTHKTKEIEQSSISAINSKEEIICNICNTKFGSQKNFKLHVKIHDEPHVRSIQEVLPQVAIQQYNRLDHFFCEICNKSFEANLLSVHKNMHKNMHKELNCNLCNRHFDNLNSYEVHKQLHTGKDDDSVTTAAIKIGPTQAALRNAKNGIKSTHVENAKHTYPCQYCGHVFWRPHEKVRHERVHTGEKPYACEICGKKFRVPYSLTLHLRTHTDIRPFVCATCNKRFKSHSVYTHHLRTHIKERTFSCDLCNKSCKTSVQLIAHKNSHTKPFNCTLCNRPFASLYAVKAHLKSHDKSKLYENIKHNCNICGAAYEGASALCAHLNDHKLSTIDDSKMNLLLDEEPTLNGTEFADDNADNEVDEAALLLINAAAEAEAHRQSVEFQFDHCGNDVIDNSLGVSQDYLRDDELILDTFDAEETVVTGF